MAFIQFSVPVPVPVPNIKPRTTDTLIQYIIDNKLNKLKKQLPGHNINGLYPSEPWNDDVTLLTAAVVCGNEEICNFLLREQANPNIISTNAFSPLHYATHTPGVPLSIVRRLLAAKANPNGHQLQIFSPLQFAAKNDREDMVKALIEAGADAERNFGTNPDIDKKVENIIHQLPSGNEAFKKCRIFFEFTSAVPKKTQLEVFNLFKGHFLEEHPFTHVTLFERYFNVRGPDAEQYRQGSTKWLKDSKNTDLYIEGFINRFPKIPNENQIHALNSLYAVIRMIKEMSLQVFNEIVPIIIETLQPSGIPEVDTFNQLILNILCVIMDKSSKHRTDVGGLNVSVLKNVCSSLMTLTNSKCSPDVSILTYRLFADLYEFIPEHIRSCGIHSVPDRVLDAAEIRMDDAIKDKLKKLNTNLRYPDQLCEAEERILSKNKKKKIKKKKKKESQQEEGQETKQCAESDAARTSVEESNPNVHLLDSSKKNSASPRKWHQISRCWRPKLEKLAKVDASEVKKLGSLTIGVGPEFQIAKGSDGTEVFLGLRDDGTEVAVKRMSKFNYQALKNEEDLLRHPELEHRFIVRYVDFEEDENFGYLALQLCEYTLEEYIQNHLPEDHFDQEAALKKTVKEVLCSLKVLHSDIKDIKVLHRDIKPQNVLIDITGKARLADFGISRRLNLGQTTLRTIPAGTKYWKAKETIEEDDENVYKRSSDIQVAGMLVYYILSKGHHPFGKGVRIEGNILDGKYSLEHLKDDLAKDLVEWMIKGDMRERPKVEETLAHPFFWTDDEKLEYLKKLGNVEEVQNHRNADEELLHALEDLTVGKTFSGWKAKFPAEVVQKLDGRKKAYSEDTLGLLRFIRNLHEHYPEDAENINTMTLFPDLFGNAFKFAKDRGWNTRPSLRKWIKAVPVI